jgi:DNA-binding transcriptional LysR family regulator
MLNEIDLSRVDLNLLVLFEAVLEERHVGRAAERLNLSPSAVSHGLGRLRRLFRDPVFLRVPKGVVPSDLAERLAGPVADILARVRSVVASADPFDPSRSTRRFTIGAPDATAAVLLPSLLADIRRIAPGVNISARHLLREAAFAELDARTIDLAIAPLDEVPARFVERTVFEEDFVIATRSGHPFADEPTLERYCELQHVVVSISGDPHAYVDEVLAQRGLFRRVAVAVPNFMLALALLAETDLAAALPRSLLRLHGVRFGLTSTEAPLPLRRSRCAAFPFASSYPKWPCWTPASLGCWI